MDSKPATPLSEQSDKTKKYDRQLRLWGDHGQALLESAHVCVCGASAAAHGEPGLGASSALGAEVLRSLVLPGMGKITLVDNALVTEADFGNNLFVIPGTVGKPRGEQVLQCLLEMNPDVRGSLVEQSVEEVLHTQPHFFDSFTAVVAVNMAEKPLLELSDCLWRAKVPLLVARTYGLIGYIRVQVEEQTIIESHPDNEIPDLRLLEPFPALKQYLDSIDLDSLDDKSHSHTPYVVVVYKYLQQWILQHGALPANYRERKALGDMIRDGMRRKSPADYEENFEEAVKALNTCLTPSGVPASLQEVFSRIPSPLTPASTPFWRGVAGLQRFIEESGRMPVAGPLPDMTADTTSYVRLQNIYRDQAAQDCERALRHALAVSGGESGRGGGPVGDWKASTDSRGWTVSEFLLRLLCRHASSLRVLTGTALTDEYRDKVDLGALDPEQGESPALWYALLRAVDAFHAEFGCYPGYYAHQVEADIARLKVCVSRLLSEWSGGSAAAAIKDDHIHEMCRYGAAQIHSVAAFVGGCAAHEVIKLITGQYVPLHNTLLYHAGTATTTTLML